MKDIHIKGGSILGTARTNPTKSEEQMKNIFTVFEKLGITALVSIGGDDTAFSASYVAKYSKGKIKVAHVPKTIDNDLPLPGTAPTFGYETARHYGVQIVRNLMEDARTTSRWYIIISMGRAAGHLALGIAKASAATLSIILEEFRGRPVTVDEICDIIIRFHHQTQSRRLQLRSGRSGGRFDRGHRRKRPLGCDAGRSVATVR